MRSSLALLPVWLIWLTAACSSDAGRTLAEPEIVTDSIVEISLIDFAFTRPNIIIDAGTRVRWINTTNTFHTVTPDGHNEWQRWPTGPGSQNETFEHVFTSVGDFAYFCEPHQSIGMIGSITVR